jgi:hypothetical protein
MRICRAERPEIVMSALLPKADIRQRGLDVRFGPKGDKRLTLHDKSKFPLKKAARFGGLVADHAREPASAGER